MTNQTNTNPNHTTNPTDGPHEDASGPARRAGGRQMIYWDRTAIDLVNRLREAWGIARVGQTNSRNNGRLGKVNIYSRPEDKGRPDRAIITCCTLDELRDAVDDAEDAMADASEEANQ